MNIKSHKAKNIIVIIIFTILCFIIVSNQAIISRSITSSLKLCLSSIIPSVFPFMILSDFLISNLEMSYPSSRKSTLSSTTYVKIIVFLIGNICGFPLGVHLASKLNDKNLLSDEDYIFISYISSNASLAFIISGVGLGMRSSLNDGVLLYISIFFATIITSTIYNKKTSARFLSGNIGKNFFSLSSSIKNATLSSIFVCSYIMFFSMIINFIISLNLPQVLTLLLAPVLEIGNGAFIISKSSLSGSLSLAYTAFTLGFSGISVYMQISNIMEEKMNTIKYFTMKLTEGIIAFIITFVISKLL